jgi:hypothetical protein
VDVRANDNLGYEFLRRESEDEIVCPTCGTIHSNDFANKFSLISDVDTCREFLIEVRKDIEAVDNQIAAERERLQVNLDARYIGLLH